MQLRRIQDRDFNQQSTRKATRHIDSWTIRSRNSALVRKPGSLGFSVGATFRPRTLLSFVVACACSSATCFFVTCRFAYFAHITRNNFRRSFRIQSLSDKLLSIRLLSVLRSANEARFRIFPNRALDSNVARARSSVLVLSRHQTAFFASYSFASLSR